MNTPNDYSVCPHCGLSISTGHPTKCALTKSLPQTKETKATMKIKLQINTEPIPEPVRLLNIGVHRTAAAAGFDEVTLFTFVAGQEVNLVGIRVCPDGLVATRWNPGPAGDGIVSKDLTGRIKDLWNKQT
jgi:hypothetical protein